MLSAINYFKGGILASDLHRDKKVDNRFAKKECGSEALPVTSVNVLYFMPTVPATARIFLSLGSSRPVLSTMMSLPCSMRAPDTCRNVSAFGPVVTLITVGFRTFLKLHGNWQVSFAYFNENYGL